MPIDGIRTPVQPASPAQPVTDKTNFKSDGEAPSSAHSLTFDQMLRAANHLNRASREIEEETRAKQEQRNIETKERLNTHQHLDPTLPSVARSTIDILKPNTNTSNAPADSESQTKPLTSNAAVTRAYETASKLIR